MGLPLPLAGPVPEGEPVGLSLPLARRLAALEAVSRREPVGVPEGVPRALAKALPLPLPLPVALPQSEPDAVALAMLDAAAEPAVPRGDALAARVPAAEAVPKSAVTRSTPPSAT